MLFTVSVDAKIHSHLNCHVPRRFDPFSNIHVQERVACGDIELLKVEGSSNLADVLTKHWTATEAFPQFIKVNLKNFGQGEYKKEAGGKDEKAQLDSAKLLTMPPPSHTLPHMLPMPPPIHSSG